METINPKREQFDLYVETLRSKYETSSPEQRLWIISDLEKFVGKVLMGKIHDRQDEGAVFKKEEARRIRLGENLSAAGLSKELGIPSANIIGYEHRGFYRVPRKNKQQENTRRYLEWLKDKGYNPFNI